MASNNYTQYNYGNYQTAPTQPQQYQQTTAPVITTQGTDYMSYPSQSYGNQGNNSWAESNYGGNRETTSRAAEVLRNMSNTPYIPHTTAAVNQPGFTATNTASTNVARYSNAPSAQHSHTSHLSYGQSQPRPRSVDTNRAQTNAPGQDIPPPVTTPGYHPQRTQNVYQQRTGSPAQGQYAHNTTAQVSSIRDSAISAASNYSNYNNRQLPSIDASRNSQSASEAPMYSYAEAQSTTSIAQPTAPANVTDQFSQGTTTVDPSAVYDPWPEYERQQEKLRQQRAEEERKAEKTRREEDARKEEERRKEEDQKKAREAAQPKQMKAQANKKGQNLLGTTNDTSIATTGTEDSATGEGDGLESEIRAMMAKMRELNSKDPALLARIWEEERRAKAPKSPTVQSKSTLQPAATQPSRADQHKKAVPKETLNPATSSRLQSQTPVTPQPAVTKPPTPASARPIGQTIWPPEKKTQVANAAAEYLNSHNTANPITADNIITMLDGNPSYIELCEQLEAMALKLDRAAFAKNILTAVPDVNSASRYTARTQSRASKPPSAAPMKATTAQRVQVPPAAVQRVEAPPTATIEGDVSTPVTPDPRYVHATQAPSNPPYPPLSFSGNNASVPHTEVLVAEMVPIKPEMKLPANKEEAARKRNINDLIDLTAMSEEDDMEPVAKKPNMGLMHSQSPGPSLDDSMDANEPTSRANNFSIASSEPSPNVDHMSVAPAIPQLPPPELRYAKIVDPLEKKMALRRSTYNIGTIARDVLLASGRHPEERQLNGHLEVMKTMLPSVTNDADLSTLRWDLIDPGRPPPGFYKDSVQTLAEDADDEEDSEDERAPRVTSQTIGAPATTNARVQALPPTNPFKIKKRGRPPKDSNSVIQTPHTPPNQHRTTSLPTPTMSGASSTSPGSGIGYSALRATQYGPDGQPLPKKKGRPVGWRKAIHGSAAAQARTNPIKYKAATLKAQQFAPSNPSSLRNVETGDDGPITIHSRSPSVTNGAPQYQSFKCKWHNCSAELHNLDTLKKHVFKMHRKETLRGTLECQWGECGGKEITNVDQNSGMRMMRYEPLAFTEEAKWREHLEISHFSPLAWQLGDGPASGHSDAHDSEAYLSDALERRQVTPRVTAGPIAERSPSNPNSSPARGRGRPPKVKQEHLARETQDRLVSQKKRVGGPGMDRGGATLVNEKRRKGFSDDGQTEEQFIDAEK